jgi:hypothetical protein
MEFKIIEHVAKNGGQVRLLGGRAVAWLCGSRIPTELKRVSDDIDLFVCRADRAPLNRALAELGCSPVKEFNLLNGKERLMFYHGDTKIDVFVDAFRMCHALDFRSRVAYSSITLPPADLLLTKLQIVETNRKDFVDLAAMLLALPLDPDDIRGIDTAYLADRLAADWGLWRTATGTLAKLRHTAADLFLEGSEWAAKLAAVLDTVDDVIAKTPKSIAWKLRAVAGERITWYEMPEEPDER